MITWVTFPLSNTWAAICAVHLGRPWMKKLCVCVCARVRVCVRWGMEYGFWASKSTVKVSVRDDLSIQRIATVREVSIWGDYDLVARIISHIVYRSNVYIHVYTYECALWLVSSINRGWYYFVLPSLRRHWDHTSYHGLASEKKLTHLDYPTPSFKDLQV